MNGSLPSFCKSTFSQRREVCNSRFSLPTSGCNMGRLRPVFYQTQECLQGHVPRFPLASEEGRPTIREELVSPNSQRHHLHIRSRTRLSSSLDPCPVTSFFIFVVRIFRGYFPMRVFPCAEDITMFSLSARKSRRVPCAGACVLCYVHVLVSTQLYAYLSS